MRIDLICPFCEEEHTVEVNFTEFMAWCIQDAMPNLSPIEREQLISHLCPKCQAEIFGMGEE